MCWWRCSWKGSPLPWELPWRVDARHWPRSAVLRLWSDYLADDYQLGNKVHRAGWRIALDGCFVESMVKTESLTTVLSRQLRWARTMRVSRPGGYLASGITLPFPAAVLALLTAPSLLSGLAAVTPALCRSSGHQHHSSAGVRRGTACFPAGSG